MSVDTSPAARRLSESGTTLNHFASSSRRQDSAFLELTCEMIERIIGYVPKNEGLPSLRSSCKQLAILVTPILFYECYFRFNSSSDGLQRLQSGLQNNDLRSLLSTHVRSLDFSGVGQTSRDSVTQMVLLCGDRLENLILRGHLHCATLFAAFCRSQRLKVLHLKSCQPHPVDLSVYQYIFRLPKQLKKMYLDLPSQDRFRSTFQPNSPVHLEQLEELCLFSIGDVSRHLAESWLASPSLRMLFLRLDNDDDYDACASLAVLQQRYISSLDIYISFSDIDPTNDFSFLDSWSVGTLSVKFSCGMPDTLAPDFFAGLQLSQRSTTIKLSVYFGYWNALVNFVRSLVSALGRSSFAPGLLALEVSGGCSGLDLQTSSRQEELWLQIDALRAICRARGLCPNISIKSD